MDTTNNMGTHWLYILTDNQTVAILISAVIGLFIWFWRHNAELREKYFSEYINYIFGYLDLKQKEIGLRKAKNRRFWDFANIEDGNKTFKGVDREALNKKGLFQDQNYLQNNLLLEGLDKERIETAGLIQARVFLLRKLHDYRWKIIENIRYKFDKKYKEFTNAPCAHEDTPEKTINKDTYQKECECINSHLEEDRGEIFSIFNKL